MNLEPTTPAPCPFRRVYRGQTLCNRATDEFDRAVWTEVCVRCPVPGWIAAGICRHLDIGTEVGKRLGADVPRVYTACRFFGVRLDGLGRCRECPEFSAWDGKVEEEAPAAGQTAQAIPTELVEKAVRAAVEQHMQAGQVRMMPRCFRVGATQCLRGPQLVPNWVLIVPPPSLRATEPYRALIAEVLKSGGLEALFFLGPLRDVDSLCDLCLSVQQCARLVVDLSEWDGGALFALGLAGALGRPALLIRGRDATPPFTPQGLPISEYATGEDLAMLLVHGLGLQIRETKEEEKSSEQETEKTAPKTRAAKKART